MRRIKYLLWVIIAAFLLTFIFQNWAFFNEPSAIGIDLKVVEYNSPQLPSGVYYLAVFLIGMLVSFFISLSKRFQNRKTIRSLKEQIAVDERRISELENRHAEIVQPGVTETISLPPGQTDTTYS